MLVHFTVAIWLFLYALAAPALAVSATGDRTLVVLDSLEHKDYFTAFFAGLQGRGFDITYGRASDKAIELFKFSDRQFDHLVYFASGSDPSPNLSVGKLIEFVDDGGNILVAASSNVSDTIRDFALEFSADFDEVGSAVLDEFSNGPFEGSIVSNNILPGKIVGTASVGPIIFRGVGHRITHRNPLITVVLAGNPTTYSADRTEVLDGSPIVGQQVALVSALQARNNARVCFSGSVELFSNQYLAGKVDGKESGNRVFVNEVAKWTFQEKNVLKVVGVFHHRENETAQHGIYRIKDDMAYEIHISSYQGNKWVPFVADDIQFEAVMLDPYVRSTLSLVSKSEHYAKYATTFKLPDRHGVFTFRVEYKRHGLSWLTTKDVVEVRPFRHNDYPRYITQAYPYYANAFSLVIGFVFISAMWLYHKDAPKAKIKTN